MPATRRPRLTLLTGHSAPVACSAFSPDGRTLATGSYDRTIVLWDTESGAMQHRLTGHRHSVSELAFSPDGSVLASADSGQVRLWDPRSGRTERIIRGYFGPLIYPSDEPSLLLAFGEDKAVWLNIRTGAPVRTLPVSLDESYSPPRVAASLDGSTMTTAIYRDFTTLYVCDLRTGELKCTRRFPDRIGWKVRDPFTGKLRTVYSSHRDNFETFALSPDGRLLAVGGSFSLWLCDTRTGRRTRLLIHSSSGPHSLVFSADGEVLASGFRDGSIRLWSVPSGKPLRSLGGHTTWASTLAFSSDGALLASGSHDKTVRLWRASSGECLRKLSALEFDVSGVAFSSDGKIIASGHEDSTVRLWDAATGEIKRVLRCRGESLTSLALAASGNTVAASSGQHLDWSAPGAMELWHPGTGALTRSFTVSHGPLWSLALSHDGRILVGSSSRPERGVTLAWETGMGRLLYRVEGGTSALSPDGQLLATAIGWEEKITLFGADTGTTIRELASPKNRDILISLLFSPDGRTLVGGYLGFGYGLWDVASGRLLWEGRTYSDSNSSLAFSPDGETLAVGGDYDRTVELWNIQSRRKRVTLKGHSNNIRSVAFSPDGTKVVSASADGTVRLWNADSGCLLATLMVLPSVRGEISEDWIAFTPQGYYQASPGAARFIRWSAGAVIYDAERFEGMFHRPEMLEETL